MVETPQEFQTELKRVGRLQYHRFRRVAAMLHYYRIDPITIEDRLMERGCSREFAMWIVKTASEDANLAKRVEDADTPESMGQVVLKGMNGVILLVIVFLVARYIQVVESMPLLFIAAPFLLIASLVGSLMTIRGLVEIRRRLSDRT